METAHDVWAPYEPTMAAPWNLQRATHLYRRAAFAATWPEIERDLQGKPQDAVTRLMAGKSRIDGVPADFESTATMLVEAASNSMLDRRLKAAWVYRMLFSPDPLGEHLTLVWHNHFATSNLKVQNLKYIQQQNDLLRKNARGHFPDLLVAAVESPAMLIWLDADKNIKQHPNENLGRELLELFTLGIGNYKEEDVRQTARALTGLCVVADACRLNSQQHDDGEKTILGHTESFDGRRLLTLLAQQPATARRVAWRICQMLLADSLADDAAINSLAARLRENELDVGAAVETVLRSQRFFSTENLAAMISSPPQFAIGAVRALEYFSPPPSTLLIADWMARMGQDLYYPPNVGGWPGGRGWLTSGSIVARANFMAAMVTGRLSQPAAPLDVAALVARRRGEASLTDSIAWLAELSVGGLPRDKVKAIEQEAMRQSKNRGEVLSAAVLILLARPEAHLM
jgi:uncharacterized protein (DUF1800 family)